MKNKEKFKDEILDLACKAVTCHTDTLKDWLESQYKGE